MAILSTDRRTGGGITPQLRAFAFSFLAAGILLVGGGLFTRWRMYRLRRQDPTAHPPAGRLAAVVNIVMGIGALVLFLVAPMEHHNIGVNESATIGSLRSLATAQEWFRKQVVVDLDGDGTGEFGFPGELAGTDPVRGSGKTMSVSPFIAAVLGRRHKSSAYAAKNGYLYVLYLPSVEHGHVATVPGAGSAPAIPADADLQEQRWAAYAWPLDAGMTGNRAFFVNQDGAVYACNNRDGTGSPHYDGPAAPPPPTAIFSPDGSGGKALDGALGVYDSETQPEVRAQDGQRWYPAGN
jgi:hypothetical protein